MTAQMPRRWVTTSGEKKTTVAKDVEKESFRIRRMMISLNNYPA